MAREIPLAKPGEILLEDFLKPLSISPDHLAGAIHVPVEWVNDIIGGRRPIDAEAALRLGRFFGTDAQSWLNLQTHYDTELMRENLAKALEQIRPHGIDADGRAG